MLLILYVASVYPIPQNTCTIYIRIPLNTNELSLYKHYNSPETAAALAYLNII